MKSKSSLLTTILAGSIAALLAVRSAQATTLYWDVNGTAAGFSTVVGGWNTGNFFNTDSTGGAGGSVGNVTTSADDLIIKQATTNTGSITVTGTKSVSSITFAANVGPTTNITGGTSITIGGAGSSSGIFEASTGANKVSTSLILNSTVSAFNFSNTSTGLLTISAVTGAAAGTQTITVGSSSTGGITLSGTIADGGGGGNVALNINSSGAGITTLSAANTYTGGTTLTAGTLVANNTGALPGYNSPGKVVFSGGTLQVAPVSGWATADIDTLLSNSTKTSGKLGLDTTSGSQTQWTAFTGGGNFGGLGLQKAGSNTLILNQANTYTGATTVTGGILQINTGGSITNTPSIALSTGTQLVFNSSGSLSYGGVISGGSASAANVTQQGGGTLTLSGNNSFQGQLVVSNGTVSIPVWNNGGSNGPLGSNTGTSGQTILGGSGTTGTLEYTGGSVTSNKSLNLATSGTGVVQIDNAATVMNLSVGSGAQVTGSGNLVKTGAGALQLSRSGNSYTGTTTVQVGSLIAGTDALGTGTTGAFGSSAAGAIVLGNGSTGAGDAPTLLNGGFTVGRDINVGSVSNSNAYNATIGGSNTTGTSNFTGNITLSTTAANYTATLQAATGGTVDFNTGTWTTNDKAIAIGSVGNTGTVQLSNALTTAGGISVNYGTLALNAAYTGNLAVVNSATFSGTGAGSVTGNVNYTSNTGSTFAGVIAGGTSTLTMNSAGTTLTLSGVNTYSGNTTVHAGTLALSGAGSFNNSPNIIVGDAGSTGTHLDVTATGGLTIGVAQTLKGIGQIDGNTTILGAHAPGNSPGLQTFNGNLIYSTGSMLNWELASNVSTDTTGLRGVHFDAVNVIGTGTLSIATGVTSNLIFNGAGSSVNFSDSFWTTNHSWQVYSDANLPTLTSGLIFDTINVSLDSLGATFTEGSFAWNEVGNDVFLNFTPTAVPEPAGVAVGLLCMGAAAFRRRRRA